VIIWRSEPGKDPNVWPQGPLRVNTEVRSCKKHPETSKQERVGVTRI